MNAGEIIQSRYRLEEELGRGGMATVWRAHDLRLERPVALKCLTAPLAEDPEYLVRFFAEAQQVARLSHPNVVRVLDFGQGEECPYLVMEYLPGGSLVELTESPVEPERAIALISGAARGAGAAHSAGMVHRDLKPGNILLTEDGTPKVADFGIAVTGAQERLTATGTAIGSPHYVSPEHASGRPVGPQSDVYSLGIVLYQLLAGRRPFESDNLMALAIAHVEEEPEPPSTHNPELSAEIDAAVMRCLSKDPDERFADGAEMAAALDSLGADGATAALVAPAIATSNGTAVDEITGEPPMARNTRRVASVSLLVALFLGLLVFGVMALGGDGGRNEEKAVAGVEQDGSINDKESPSKNRAASDTEGEELNEESAPVGAPSPSPTRSASDGSEETEKTVTKETTEESQEEEFEEDQEEPAEEPAPEPTSEPTEEPAPEPTSTP